MITKGYIVLAADVAAGRLASGDIERLIVFEEVPVRCYVCHGVTVFVLQPGAPRLLGKCLHCGTDI